MKHTISIDNFNPIEIYGPNNIILNEFNTYFPDLQVIDRGNELILEGEENRIKKYKSKFSELIKIRKRKLSLTKYDVEDLFSEERGAATFKVQGDGIITYSTDAKPIRARTANQQKMVQAYFKNDLVFAIGPAGTGKTYLAIALAVRALKAKEIRKIILTRPAVEAGERLGFLPGDMRDKLDPYLQPLYDALGDMIPAKKLAEYMEEGTIQIAPLAYMRGRTLDQACVILDEAQNTNLGQLKMFLTRMGRNAKFIVTGDASQVDLPNKQDSGLIKGIKLVEKIDGISTISFGKEDIVRHQIGRAHV